MNSYFKILAIFPVLYSPSLSLSHVQYFAAPALPPLPLPLVTACLFSTSVSASLLTYSLELPSWLSGKQPACQCRRHKRHVFDPWVRKIPWRGEHGNPLQYSCPENPMDRGTWQATVHGVAESDMTDIFTSLLYFLGPTRE